MNKDLINELINLSLSMFRKNFFGIFHGSISKKLEENRFIINSKNAIFDELKEEDFITLNFQEDYRYKTASLDAFIHKTIYENISDAKYICYTMPPNITALSLKKNNFKPKDYFGNLMFPFIKIYDPGDFKDWYQRAPKEITDYFTNKHEIMIIKGYGIYAYSRDSRDLVQKIAIIENSARLLMLK